MSFITSKKKEKEKEASQGTGLHGEGGGLHMKITGMAWVPFFVLSFLSVGLPVARKGIGMVHVRSSWAKKKGSIGPTTREFRWAHNHRHHHQSPSLMWFDLLPNEIKKRPE